MTESTIEANKRFFASEEEVPKQGIYDGNQKYHAGKEDSRDCEAGRIIYHYLCGISGHVWIYFIGYGCSDYDHDILFCNWWLDYGISGEYIWLDKVYMRQRKDILLLSLHQKYIRLFLCYYFLRLQHLSCTAV